MDKYHLELRFDVTSESETLEAVKTYPSLSAAMICVNDFLQEFGEPDAGEQTITIVLKSTRT